jgi:hypothetical protein
MNPQDQIKLEVVIVMNPQGGFCEIQRPDREI